MMQISGKCKNAPAYIHDAPSKSVKNAGEYF